MEKADAPFQEHLTSGLSPSSLSITHTKDNSPDLERQFLFQCIINKIPIISSISFKKLRGHFSLEGQQNFRMQPSQEEA